MSDLNLPLARFTVLDLTRVRSGPTAVRQLADWGADVIKIEAPETVDVSKGMGGARHGPDFQNIQRNKRSITLNLKSPEGVALFKKLLAKSDVVVENYRPDVKHKLGVDYDTVRSINKKIVYASISGFGQQGPYSQRPGFDQIAQGMGGLMSITGLPGQGPVRVGIPIADLTAGLYAAIGILIALLEREVSGQGQWVQTSLLQAQISMLDFQAARWLIKNEVPQQAGNNHPTSIPTGVFRTADGFINIATTGEAIWQRLCQALNAGELLDNANYANAELRLKYRDELNKTLEEYVSKLTSERCIQLLNEAGVPCGPIYSIDQVFNDSQVKTLGMSEPVETPGKKGFNVLGQPINFNRSSKKKFTAAPERGEHTEEILTELGLQGSEIDALRNKNVI